ncbi:hypothetical protein BS78_01G284800 [Paspalum vaginatum]|nr:hypothetical protein BS78_01G284800 [Paspalum vaginatum]
MDPSTPPLINPSHILHLAQPASDWCAGSGIEATTSMAPLQLRPLCSLSLAPAHLGPCTSQLRLLVHQCGRGRMPTAAGTSAHAHFIPHMCRDEAKEDITWGISTSCMELRGEWAACCYDCQSSTTLEEPPTIQEQPLALNHKVSCFNLLQGWENMV